MLLKHDLGMLTVLLHADLQWVRQDLLDIFMALLLGPVSSRVAVPVADLRVDTWNQSGINWNELNFRN